MSEPKKMWSTHDIYVSGTPLLISVTRAFKSGDYYINLDSIYENGEDEYLPKSELFESKLDAIKSGIDLISNRKRQVMQKYNDLDILYQSLVCNLIIENCKNVD